jgi:hypothetical protein
MRDMVSHSLEFATVVVGECEASLDGASGERSFGQ